MKRELTRDKNRGMEMKKRIKLHEVSLEQDIDYRGPLSYRHFRIIGWICIAISQVYVLLGIVIKISPPLEEVLGFLPMVLNWIGVLSIPLLLLASFSVILGSDSGYKKQLILMGGAAAAVIALFELFFFRYIVGTFGHVLGSNEEALSLVNGIINEKSSSHFLAFNLFVDVVLCILFTYFLNYQPSKGLQGKKLVLFRLCALIPVIYEAVSFTLKVMAVNEQLVIPTALFPFLTSKPPMMFLVFVALAFYIKNRERRFCKTGRTHQEYQAFLKTNRNSWNFSVFTAKILVLAGAADFIFLLVVMLIMGAPRIEAMDAPGAVDVLTDCAYKAADMGFGKSIVLAPFAPVLLLFSYTRTYKKNFIDLLIPIGGVILIIFVYLEGIYYGSSFIGSAALG